MCVYTFLFPSSVHGGRRGSAHGYSSTGRRRRCHETHALKHGYRARSSRAHSPPAPRPCESSCVKPNSWASARTCSPPTPRTPAPAWTDGANTNSLRLPPTSSTTTWVCQCWQMSRSYTMQRFPSFLINIPSSLHYFIIDDSDVVLGLKHDPGWEAWR